MVKIIVMEDDPDQAQTLYKTLTKAGCEVDITHSGSEAWLLLQQKHFDVLITDMHVQAMPDAPYSEGGLELIIRVRRAMEQGKLYNANDSLKIIAVTGVMNYGQERLERASIFGADISLLKPVLAPALLKSLQDVMKHA